MPTPLYNRIWARLAFIFFLFLPTKFSPKVFAACKVSHCRAAGQEEMNAQPHLRIGLGLGELGQPFAMLHPSGGGWKLKVCRHRNAALSQPETLQVEKFPLS